MAFNACLDAPTITDIYRRYPGVTFASISTSTHVTDLCFILVYYFTVALTEISSHISNFSKLASKGKRKNVGRLATYRNKSIQLEITSKLLYNFQITERKTSPRPICLTGLTFLSVSYLSFVRIVYSLYSVL